MPLKRIQHIQSRLAQAMIRDGRRISLRLENLKTRLEKGMFNQRLLRQLDSMERQLETSIRRKATRVAERPRVTYPQHLPIFEKKDEIIEAVRKHPVVIVAGDTGSGKSTQIPKMCLEADRGIAGKIGCTQPRRIAASSIAQRIAEELGERLGKSVGYKVRFTDRTGPGTYVKLMTDGILLAEAQGDPWLSEYDTLIIDEAHERSLNVDFLLGILRTLLPKRTELRVVIASATLDTEKFSEAFGGAPVIQVQGRVFAVETKYLSPDLDPSGLEECTHVELAVRAVEQLAKSRRPGDILVFMPTEQDIRETCELLEGRGYLHTRILPLFARLTAAQQKRVFSGFSGRKIIVATNVAETSLTIPNVRFVIDTGLARIPRYLPRSRTTSLAVGPISRSSAEQRKGRCGRVRDGVCIRLYPEEDFLSRQEFTPPEILRSNLAEVILRMLSLNLGRIESFPFIDRPNSKAVKDGFDLLVELGAVIRDGKEYSLTEKGRLMARMPIDPRISRMLLEAHEEQCIPEVAVIGAALSIQDPRERPLEKAEQADQIHARFRHLESDFLTLLNIWNIYHRALEELKTQSKMRNFCKEHFLSYVRIREWRDIHQQIMQILEEQGFARVPASQKRGAEKRYAAIHRSILSGYLSNIAVKREKNLYLATKGREVMIFPGSSLFNRGAPWIVAAEMVKTSRLFARTVAKIDPQWLEDLGGRLCKYTYSEPYWDKHRGEVRAYETVKLYGLVVVPRRAVSYGSIRPKEAHEIFIRSALVRGEIPESFSFLSHNQGLRARVQDMEERLRHRGILASEETLARFYSQRLPEVYDIRTLRQRIKLAGGERFLRMKEEDLVLTRPDEEVLTRYPKTISVRGHDFQLSYKFSPGSEDDGVTVLVPSTHSSLFPPERLEWLVPGLFKDKILALLKALPKHYRKQLIPVPRTANIIHEQMERTEEALKTALSRFVYQRFGVDIPAGAWPDEGIPEYLRMRICIIDHEGRSLKAGRNPDLLAFDPEEMVDEGKGLSTLWDRTKAKWERPGLTSWDLGRLPEQISLGPRLVAFPGLEPDKGCVNLRLFTNALQALESHQKGVEVLFSLHLRRDLKYLKRIMKIPLELSDKTMYFGGVQELERSLYKALLHRLFRRNVRTEEDFYGYAREVRSRLIPEAKALLDSSVRIVQAFAEARLTLQKTESANPSNKPVLELCAEIKKDLGDLLPRDFPQVYSLERLDHLPRYLKALGLRAARAANDPQKDAKKAQELRRFIKALGELTVHLSPHCSQEKRDAIEGLRWMIEEYKVSLFAQELKTPYPISAKRLDQKLQEIHRMA